MPIPPRAPLWASNYVHGAQGVATGGALAAVVHRVDADRSVRDLRLPTCSPGSSIPSRGDPELAGETQLDLRWAYGLRGCAPPTTRFYPPLGHGRVFKC
jgi:hypothetical protein